MHVWVRTLRPNRTGSISNSKHLFNHAFALVGEPKPPPPPSSQAMDRAHRLGQTRPVTVYRLTCRGTIEEKVLRRAAQKNTVQQLVR